MKTQLTCAGCGNCFLKENKELNRRRRLGHTSFYCGLSCHAVVVNSTPQRRLLNSKIAFQNFSPFLNNEDFLAKAMYGSQKWKYQTLEKYFSNRGVPYQFEFPMRDLNGNIRIYDLVLPMHCLLVEFDGPNHQTDRRYANTVDRMKNLSAESNGWSLLRVNVQPNAVIPEEVGIAILFHLF